MIDRTCSTTDRIVSHHWSSEIGDKLQYFIIHEIFEIFRDENYKSV